MSHCLTHRSNPQTDRAKDFAPRRKIRWEKLCGSVVDTLGWGWRSVQDKSERVKREVVRSVHLCPPETHALLLVVSGDMTFTGWSNIWSYWS